MRTFSPPYAGGQIHWANVLALCNHQLLLPDLLPRTAHPLRLRVLIKPVRNAMNSLVGSNSQTWLCEVCGDIDFKSIAQSARYCTKSLQEEEIRPQIKLGTTDDIIQRERRCELCKTIAKSFRRTCPNLVGEFRLHYADFCISSSQMKSAATVPDGPHVHTTTGLVQLHPKQYYAWAPQPLEREIHDSQVVQHILNLQAGSTSARDLDVRKRIHLGQEPSTMGITARRVLPNFDENLPKHWLSTCERKHAGVCSHDSSVLNWEDGFMPMFVIDVEQMCIRNTPHGCHYVALSYVWGKGKMLKHVTANSFFLFTPGSLTKSDVPNTIRDAIHLVRSMEERYLWVDALCIIQNDDAMQQSQIAKMDRIYEKALFTIIAASGNSSEAGLPGVNRTRREQAQEILHLPDCDLFTLICKPFEDEYPLQKVELDPESMDFARTSLFWPLPYIHRITNVLEMSESCVAGRSRARGCSEYRSRDTAIERRRYATGSTFEF